jgi:hypothetical protein
MPIHRFSMLESDGFEMQTDGMSAGDAQTELLSRVRTAHTVVALSQKNEFFINYETTRDGIRVIREATPIEKPEMAPAEMREAPFVAWRLLGEIEEMLDREKNSFWRLHLKQRRTGEQKIPLAVLSDIYEGYTNSRLSEPETPKKVIIGQLAQKYGVTDTTMRGIIRRAGDKQRRGRVKGKG